MASRTTSRTATPVKKHRCTIDEYKREHGQSCFDFLRVGSLTHLPEVPVGIHKMISDTLKEINEIYVPYAWSWVVEKKKASHAEILEMEDEIRVAVLCENQESLRDALDRYYQLWVKLIIEFSATSHKYVPF